MGALFFYDYSLLRDYHNKITFIIFIEDGYKILIIS